MKAIYCEHRVQVVDRHVELPVEISSDKQGELRALLGVEDTFVARPTEAMQALAREALDLVASSPGISAEELAGRLPVPRGVQGRTLPPAFAEPWIKRTIAVVRRRGSLTVEQLADELGAPLAFTNQLVRILQHYGRLRVDS